MRWRAAQAMAIVLLAASVAAAAWGGDRTVVLLLFDGFASAYVSAVPTPTLERLRREGAWSHHMTPAFPSISLTNQTTISTGCWPAQHGIVTNSFLDPQRGEYDHSHDADWLAGCEHLHSAAERQGVRSAALGWVGRFSGTRGDLASYTSAERRFDEFPTDAQRAEQVIRMLQLPDAERPRLILGYFGGPDQEGHFAGMEAEATRAAVIETDAIIGRILAAIEALPFHDRVTLIVTTDHGMVPVSWNVNVQKLLANHGITAGVRSAGTSAFLYFDDPAAIEPAQAKLSGYAQFDVVRATAPPADWHIGHGPRVGELIISAKPPYFIEDIKRWPRWTHWLGTWGPEFLWAGFAIKATHGYPPDTPGVEGILYAWGAGVPAGREVPSVRAIDVHPTVAHLLGIEPGTPVDGTVARALVTR
ncbi:MAG: alkaline phosphatase family protein [Candidatus Binatia bacterium]